MSDYDLGRHDERRRTMQLIGGVRMDAQTGAAGDVLDKLVTCIVSEPLPNVRPNAVPLDARERAQYVRRTILWDWAGLQRLSIEELGDLIQRIAAALTTTPLEEVRNSEDNNDE